MEKSRIKSYRFRSLEKVYGVTAVFPQSEMYGLTSQLRRAAVSIPSNIAEGASRDSTKEFIHFLIISNGSFPENGLQLQINHIRSMLCNLIKILKTKVESNKVTS